MRTLRQYIQPAKVIKPTYTKQELIDDITNGVEIDGFFGGIERTLAEVENYIISPAVDEIIGSPAIPARGDKPAVDAVIGQPAQKEVGLLNKYMFVKSVDGLSVAIYIADPLSYKDDLCISQLPSSSWTILNKFINAIVAFDGVTRVEAANTIFTKSEFMALIKSDKYQPKVDTV